MIVDERRLDALLVQAGADATWPETPDLRAAVIARLAVPAAPDLRPGVVARIGQHAKAPLAVPGAFHPMRPQRSTLRRSIAPLALAAVLLLVVAGIAAALGFRLPGLELERVETLPPAGIGLDLGQQISLDEARSFDHVRVLLPASLPAPGTAYLLGTREDPIVTVTWRAEPGDPTLAGSDLALSLMAVPGAVDGGLLHKLASPATSIEPVTVGPDPGWWVSGAPHEILIRGPGGSVDVLRSALVGDTLLFARDGTLYRLESALGRDATLAIASSMR